MLHYTTSFNCLAKAMGDGDALLTVEEVAARLRVHPETIRRWLRAGQMRGVRVGGRRSGWRVRVTEVDLVLAGARQLELPDSGNNA